MTKARTPSPPAQPVGYLERTHHPLNCLALVGVLLIAYEAAAAFFASRLAAPQDLARFLGLFGATGRFVPPALIILVMLIWQFASKQPWHIDLGTVGGMAVESAVGWLPLWGANLLAGRLLGRSAAAAAQAVSWAPDNRSTAGMEILRGIGAGVYEEFLFRLVVMSIVMLITVDIAKCPKKYMAPLAIVLSAALFSSYHFQVDSFDWHRWVFYFVAGVYLAVVYIVRGFGVAVGVHACYNIAMVLLRNAPPQ